MSRLEGLIQKLCPNGVEWRELEKIAMISNGKDHKLLSCGDIPVYGSGGIMRYVDKSIYDKESVLIPRKGSISNIFYANVPFWTVDTIFYTQINYEIILPKYLYYFMKTQDLQKLNIAGGVPSLTKSTLNKILIPLPPLEIQEEIVHILDLFTELTNELTNELTARRKQYEYYRDSLLTFGDEVEWKKLGEVCELKTGGTPKTTIKKYWDNGTIPWMSSGEVNNGKIYTTEKMITQDGFDKSNTKILPINSIVIALAGQGTTRGKVAITKIELCTNQSLCGLIPDSNLNSYFLYFYLQTQYSKLREVSSGDGTRGGLNLNIIHNYAVPIPSLSEQERIVSILDKFDSLCNDISEGLPAEIEARKKQYEYYRDKLLTFKKVEV